ncbi:MAG: polyisoprenoid-binding protein [Xanthomonadales bacterium]|nr:polyisoprenoid-binding protein [Xanthomonadales bacterium]MCA0196987.1 YceI family protein [Pseudomonadota bacterium]HRF84868.1 YceI family protein [Pseudoxanthomonas sp.]
MRIRLLSAAALLAFVTAPAFAGPVTYKLDPAHTNVLAQWSHFGFSNPFANFGQVEGAVVYDPDNVGNSSVQVTLPLSGLEAFSPKFNEHLRSADFFDAARFPNATFKSTRVEAAGEGKLKVTGELTIKDVTRPVVLDATLNKAGVHPMTKAPTIGFDATTTISRTEFGVGAYAPNVGDAVTLRITTEASAPKGN